MNLIGDGCNKYVLVNYSFENYTVHIKKTFSIYNFQFYYFQSKLKISKFNIIFTKKILGKLFY